MIKSKKSVKLLSSILAILMLISGLPFTGSLTNALAATPVLITATVNVVDTVSTPVNNAKVTIYSDIDKLNLLATEKTDITGIVEIELEEMDVYYYTVSADNMIQQEGFFTKTEAKADIQMSYAVECRTCLGVGSVECTTCRGSGEVTTSTDCTNCLGTGTVTDTCSSCNGFNSDTCDVCKGLGTESIDCEICSGTGKISSNISCGICGGNKEVVCGECNGNKIVPAYDDFEFKFEKNPDIKYNTTVENKVFVEKSSGKITYSSSDENIVKVGANTGEITAVGNAGEKATITAIIAVDIKNGYAPKTATCEVTIVQTDFEAKVSANNLTYNGLPQELVSIENANDYSSITYKVNGEVSDGKAKDAGVYSVEVTVVKDNNHKTFTTVIENVEIAKATITVIPKSGQTKAYNADLTPENAIKYDYSGEQNNEKVIFTGALSYENAGKDDLYLPYKITNGDLALSNDDINKNYELNINLNKETIKIVPAKITAVATINDLDKANSDKWFNKEYIDGTENKCVTITAPQGYKISTSNKKRPDLWDTTLKISAEGAYFGDGAFTYYLKSDKTYEGISNAKSLEFGIDTTLPELQNLDNQKAVYFSCDNNLFESIGHILTFGTYFNKKIEAKINTKDDVSGINTVSAYIKDVNDNKFAFNSNDNTNFVYSNDATTVTGTAYVTIKDKAGNVNSDILVTSENSNIKTDDSPVLMIENTSPVFNNIKITPKNVNDTGEGKKYSNDVTFSVDVTEADSALYYSEIKINDKVFKVDYTKTPQNKDTYSYSTEGIAANKEDGSYKFIVKTADAAGNVATTEDTVYVDRTAPIVKSFEISGVIEENGTIDDAFTPHVVDATSYGFYFKKAANVTVTFGDYKEDCELLSGIDKVQIYLLDKENGAIYGIDKNGNMNEITDTSKAELIPVSELENIADELNDLKSFTFEVNKDFKGQIYAKAFDNVGNDLSSEALKLGTKVPTNANEVIGEKISFNDNGFQKPNGSIIETAEKHDASYAIEIKTPNTKNTDYKGNPLYSDPENKGVDVELTVEDKYSGIKSIEVDVKAPYNTDENYNHIVTVGSDAKAENPLSYNEGSEKELDWNIVSTDENIATKMTNIINISNDSNNIVITVTLTDRAGNVSKKDYTISLDKSVPEIEVTYNNNSKNIVNGNEFYQDARVATVTVRELNLVDPSQIVVTATRDGESIAPTQYELEELIKDTYDKNNVKMYHKTKGEEGTQTEYFEFIFTLPGTLQGDYNITVAAIDNAGNKDLYNRVDTFSVDTSSPYITVTFDNNDTKNGNYYDANRKAIITVTDRYFNPNTTSVQIKSTDNGKPINNPIPTKWTKQNDKYEQSCEVTFDKDGTYSFTIDSIDMSNKVASQYKASDFVIDKTKPTIEVSINNDIIKNDSKPQAYIADVVPQVVVKDTNFDQLETKVTLTPAIIKENSNLSYDSKIISENADFENGMTYDYNNFKGEDGNQRIYDNIYVLEVSTVDKAGNTTEPQKVVFSVNRYGSTYRYKLNKYYSEKPVIQIEEVNVNAIDFDNEETYVTVTNSSGMSKTLSSKDINIQTQEATEKNWYSYLYAIPSDTFETDDIYSVKLSSMDTAKRVSTNLNDANKQEISFTVDTTNPYFEVTNYIENENIKESSYELVVDIMDDTSGVASYNVYFDGKIIPSVPAYKSDIYKNKITVKIPVEGATDLADAAGRKLKVEIIDAANRDNMGKKDKNAFNVRISSSFFVDVLAKLQDFYHNTPVFLGTTAGVIAVVGIVLWIMLAKKKKNKDDETAA